MKIRGLDFPTFIVHLTDSVVCYYVEKTKSGYDVLFALSLFFNDATVTSHKDKFSKSAVGLPKFKHPHELREENRHKLLKGIFINDVRIRGKLNER
jgi:hypothetical protein